MGNLERITGYTAHWARRRLPIFVLDQRYLPLLATLLATAQRPHAPFYTPGHRQGRGASAALRSLLGEQALQVDLPELPGLDNLFRPEGVIREAQELAAAAFGADQTWFLSNGSSCGLIAAMLATCGPGDRVILPRNCHQSLIAGLILSGARPVFVQPDYDPDHDLAYGVTPAAIIRALQAYPEAKAVWVIYPTYHGIGTDLAAIARIAHRHDCPLLVDEAHGPHFVAHPDLPPPALYLGADLVVQSSHKLLGALTQAAMLHVSGSRLDRDRLQRSLQFTQSTSPNYLLLASLDAARQQLALEGPRLWGQTLAWARTARSQLRALPGLAVLEAPQPQPGFTHFDPTRLTLLLRELNLTGFAADEYLYRQQGVVCELPMLRHITFILTPGNQAADMERLVAGCGALATVAAPGAPQGPRLSLAALPPAPLSPREATFAAQESVPLDQAAGRISATWLCPYPPGIPALMPGEVIMPAVIDYLQQVQQQGGTIVGLGDRGLQDFAVVR